MAPPDGDGMQPPSDKTEEQGQKNREWEAGNFPGEWKGGVGIRQEFGGESDKQNSMWVWVGISVAVMLAGLVFAKFYPRSRY